MSFTKNLNNLTCRRVIEESHNENILQLIEEREIKCICRYVASISPQQVNIYDNEDKNTRLGFFAHYVVEETPFFKGGKCTCGCWLYKQPTFLLDSVVSVGTSKGEIFLLSCNDCRVTSVLSNSLCTSISYIVASPVYPTMLISIDNDGVLCVWDIVVNTMIYSLPHTVVRYACWDGEMVLLLLEDGSLSIYNPTTHNVSALPLCVTTAVSGENVISLLYLKKSERWLIVQMSQFIFIDSHDLSHITSYPIEPLRDIFAPQHMSLTRDEQHLLVSDHIKTRVFTMEGLEEDSLVDNYGVGASGVIAKDQSYHKSSILNVVMHPEALYAVMVESNRVMRFDSIDPNTEYVAHVKFPHPVEDMYLFYDSLNAEPLMYLHPKVPEIIKKN